MVVGDHFSMQVFLYVSELFLCRCSSVRAATMFVAEDDDEEHHHGRRRRGRRKVKKQSSLDSCRNLADGGRWGCRVSTGVQDGRRRQGTRQEGVDV